MSQDVFAEKIGMSRATYIRIESGEKSPTLDELKVMAQVLEITVESLISDVQAESDHPIDEEKYQQILENCIEFGADKDGKITKTKLAKLAYLVDFSWYYEHFVPLTGLQYRKLEQWPVPNEYFRTIDTLLNTGAIKMEFKGIAQMIRNTESPSTSKLSTDEIKLIQDICTKWKGKSTKDIVEFTHKQLPWSICQDGEIIPYELITQEEPNHVY
jgi:transcriptional regulator with XRE-family HTH domain